MGPLSRAGIAAVAAALFAPACGDGGAAVRVPSGERFDPLAAPGGEAVVLLFVGVDCPISNRYAPEVNRLHEEYAARGVELWLVYAQPDETPEVIAEHLDEFAYRSPALRDPDLALVERTGATVTPEAAVFTPEGELVYRGRIDDRFVDFGVQRREPLHHELRDALEAVLAGRPVEVAEAPAVGCFLPRPD